MDVVDQPRQAAYLIVAPDTQLLPVQAAIGVHRHAAGAAEPDSALRRDPVHAQKIVGHRAVGTRHREHHRRPHQTVLDVKPFDLVGLEEATRDPRFHGHYPSFA